MRVHCSNSFPLTFAASEGSADGHGKQQIENRVCAAAPLERLAYGIRDAAAASGLSRSKLYELIKNGALRSVKIAGRRLVTRAALLELLNLGGE